jgi:hypothetical protein
MGVRIPPVALIYKQIKIMENSTSLLDFITGIAPFLYFMGAILISAVIYFIYDYKKNKK